MSPASFCSGFHIHTKQENHLPLRAALPYLSLIHILITVKKCIRSVANKLGGAHVDSEMESDAFLSGTLAKRCV